MSAAVEVRTVSVGVPSVVIVDVMVELSMVVDCVEVREAPAVVDCVVGEVSIAVVRAELMTTDEISTSLLVVGSFVRAFVTWEVGTDSVVTGVLVVVVGSGGVVVVVSTVVVSS